MFSNTKLLATASLLIIISGFGFLWFGFQATSEVSQPIAATFALPSHIASGNVFGIEGERAIVSKVVDGDTIELENGKVVRLIGIDTPETVDPRRPVGCFGKEASNEVKKLLTGKEVLLQKDVSETDKYKRLLRYIFLPLDSPAGSGQVLFVNDYLVREGFAKVLTYPPDIKYNEQFRQAEKESRESKRGLWGSCN